MIRISYLSTVDIVEISTDPGSASKDELIRKNLSEIFGNPGSIIEDDTADELDGLGLKPVIDQEADLTLQFEKAIQELEGVLGTEGLSRSIDSLAKTILEKNVIIPIIEDLRSEVRRRMKPPDGTDYQSYSCS